jgi:hypothetical protein
MDVLKSFLELLPVIAQMLPGDQVRNMQLAQMVTDAEREIQRRVEARGQSRDEVLSDATAEWDEDLRKALQLAQLGHEGEQPAS